MNRDEDERYARIGESSLCDAHLTLRYRRRGPSTQVRKGSAGSVDDFFVLFTQTRPSDKNEDEWRFLLFIFPRHVLFAVS
jgi:hypothetical protein